MHGTVHPLARPEYDQATVADEFPLQRLLLMMGRPYYAQLNRES